MFNKAAILAFLATQGVLAGVTKVPIFQAPKEQFLSNLLSTHTPPRLIKPSSNKASSTQRKLLRKEEQDTNYSPGENIVVRDLRNAQYYGEVHIGSKATKWFRIYTSFYALFDEHTSFRPSAPEQKFLVVYDTGSADFWVPDANCLKLSSNCVKKTAYDPTKSKTFSEVSSGAKTAFTIQYGSGPVQGKYSEDTVRIADDYKVEGQTFAQVESTVGLGDVCKLHVVTRTKLLRTRAPLIWRRFNFCGFTDSVALFDGVLGLAFPVLSQDPGVPTVLQNLVDQKKVDEPMFGFFLGDVSIMRGRCVSYLGDALKYFLRLTWFYLDFEITDNFIECTWWAYDWRIWQR